MIMEIIMIVIGAMVGIGGVFRNLRGNERDDDTDLKFEVGHDHWAHGRGCNPEDWVLKIVKVKAPSFDGQIDPKAFSD